MKTEITSKLPGVGTTIFTIMTKMALDHDAINLSQGYPDFDVPKNLVDRLAFHVKEGRNQYPPMQGIPALREAIAEKVKDCYAASVDPETEITITSGATEALFVAVQALVHPGEEVIVFDPAYDSYEPAVTLAGGVTHHSPLKGPDFRIDWDHVRQLINPKTRAIMLNSPHNPTGAVVTADDLGALAELTRDTGIFVISDEVYEHMVFDGAPHLSLVGHEELRDRSVVVSSFGKTYHATGWKIAYAIAPPAITTEFRKVHQYVTFTTHTPSQWALADFLAAHPEHHHALPAFYQAKRDLFLDAIVKAGFAASPAQGTYFQLADYSALSDEPDIEFVKRLTTQVGVAAIPVSVFYESPPAQQRCVRFCFAKSDDTLRQAARLLREGLLKEGLLKDELSKERLPDESPIKESP